MSQLMKLANVYDIIENLHSEITTSDSYYYDILYKVSTAVFESRISKDMNQNEFSNLLGVSQAMVSKYESGDYNFTIKQICKLCEKLDLHIDFSLSPIASENDKVSYQNEKIEIPLNYEVLGEAA